MKIPTNVVKQTNASKRASATTANASTPITDIIASVTKVSFPAKIANIASVKDNFENIFNLKIKFKNKN